MVVNIFYNINFIKKFLKINRSLIGDYVSIYMYYINGMKFVIL